MPGVKVGVGVDRSRPVVLTTNNEPVVLTDEAGNPLVDPEGNTITEG